jgi:sortase (surface protein transpeptidase)
MDADTTGHLKLPADPQSVGWWVSGALAGDPFGSVVLGGHIDSRRLGLGFFAQLLDIEPGDRVELTGDGLAQRYRVQSTGEVAKNALATTAAAFDMTTPGRLVLITCTGRFDPHTHHYDRNLVVIATPEGMPAHASSP